MTPNENTFGKGLSRKVAGTYVTGSIEIQHPDIRQFGKQFDAFDKAAQFVFRYVSGRVADIERSKKWHQKMSACLDECHARVEKSHAQLRASMEQRNSLPARSGNVQTFQVIIQTPFASRYRKLLEAIDRYAMLVEAALLRLEITMDEYHERMTTLREIASIPKSVIYVLNAEADTKLSEFMKAASGPASKKDSLPQEASDVSQISLAA